MNLQVQDNFVYYPFKHTSSCYSHLSPSPDVKRRFPANNAAWEWGEPCGGYCLTKIPTAVLFIVAGGTAGKTFAFGYGKHFVGPASDTGLWT